MRACAPFLLPLAALASLATSSAEPPPEPPPPVATSTASTDGSVVVGPGQAVRRTFDIGVELDAMPQITDSWVTLEVSGSADVSTASVRVRMQGFDQSNQTQFSMDANGVVDRVVTVNGVDTGCLGQGDLCWSTWTVDFTHTGGSGAAVLDYRLQANVDGVVTPLYVNED